MEPPCDFSGRSPSARPIDLFDLLHCTAELRGASVSTFDAYLEATEQIAAVYQVHADALSELKSAHDRVLSALIEDLALRSSTSSIPRCSGSTWPAEALDANRLRERNGRTERQQRHAPRGAVGYHWSEHAARRRPAGHCLSRDSGPGPPARSAAVRPSGPTCIRQRGGRRPTPPSGRAHPAGVALPSPPIAGRRCRKRPASPQARQGIRASSGPGAPAARSRSPVRTRAPHSP